MWRSRNISRPVTWQTAHLMVRSLNLHKDGGFIRFLESIREVLYKVYKSIHNSYQTTYQYEFVSVSPSNTNTYPHYTIQNYIKKGIF